MKYALVKPDGTIGSTHDFPGAVPNIAPSKGRWIPDNPPAFDPDTQKLKIAEPVSAMALEVPYQIKPLGANQIEKIARLKAAMNDATDMRSEAFTKAFADMTKADLNDYIDANVTNINDTRIYLKKLSRLVLTLVKRDIAESK